MLEETRCVTTQATVAETVCIVPRAGKMNISCPVIGYPSGQNGAIMPARDYPHYPARRDRFLGPYIKYHKGFRLDPLFARLVKSSYLDISLVLFLPVSEP